MSIAWSRDLGSGEAGWLGRPGVSGDTAVYQAGSFLEAVDLQSGALLWRSHLRTGIPVNAANVAVAAGRAYAAGGDSVYAVSLADGHRLWTYLPPAQAALCETAADGAALYAGTRAHQVFALDATSGIPQWTVDVGPTWSFTGIVTGIALAGDTVFVNVVQYLNASGSQRTGHVVALRRSDGGELWRHVSPGQATDVSGAPRPSDGQLVVGDEYGPGFFALDRGTGSVSWRVNTTPGFVGPIAAPFASNGVAFAATQGGVKAVALDSGTSLWSRDDLVGALDAAACGSALLIQNQTIQVLAPATGSSFGALLTGAEYPSSLLAVSGSRALVVGNQRVYGLRC